MKTFAERLNYALSTADINQSELAKLLNIDQQIISNLSVGRTSKCSNVAQIAKHLKCNPLWLECGEGSPYIADALPGQINEFKDKLTDNKLKTVFELCELLTNNIEPVDEITVRNFIHTMFAKSVNDSTRSKYA